MNKLIFTKIKPQGFTFTEMLIVIAIVLIIFAVTIPLYSQWQTVNVNQSEKYEVVQDLRLAQGQAIAGLNGSNFGIYFLSNQYTIYQGESYLYRNTKKDIVRQVPVYIVLSGVGEVNFAQTTGLPSVTGTIVLTNISNNSTEVIDIKSSGTLY